MKLSLRSTDASKIMNINNFTIDVCGMLEESVTSTFMNVFAPDLKRYSNVYGKCPLAVSRKRISSNHE